LPGGHIDKGEIPIEAAIRELREETDIRIEGHKTNFAGIMAGKDFSIKYFKSNIGENKPKQMEEEEVCLMTFEEAIELGPTKVSNNLLYLFPLLKSDFKFSVKFDEIMKLLDKFKGGSPAKFTISDNSKTTGGAFFR
jgi:hypothetical protein